MTLLAITNSSIILLLSFIHFYWALGGAWGFASALPTTKEGKRVLNPKKIDSAIIAIGLLAFAIYFMIYAQFLDLALPNWLHNYGIWVISGLFLLRAIGDFKYVGFFKQVRTTEFARLDTKYYSPLCLFIGATALLMAYLNLAA